MALARPLPDPGIDRTLGRALAEACRELTKAAREAAQAGLEVRLKLMRGNYPKPDDVWEFHTSDSIEPSAERKYDAVRSD